MTQPRLYIRVSLGKDGKTPVREVIFEGRKIGEISYVETIEMISQAASTLRYEVAR